ncbi:flavodoxin domain-containing protein [Streptomyces sp. RKAG337]|uniref:flavodoxin domain-containing protein n=1 Tax=Streptomyces sp. RKAG337 TaxID=2893404 RepID=UPI0020342213|nr:flavodoxin domain-containing protein [Streptomyces sp. RKAG337]MCM2430099.1 flavodoxin domain-containing protein [Streptomyces sp. RKAG337]
MTGERVLVAYASKNGSTSAIAGMVAEALREQGLAVEVLAVSEVDGVGSYHAVILGSALYAGRWRPEAVRFARHHRADLAERPVWLFSSGPLDATAGELVLPPVAGVQRIADRLKVRGHVTFGGCLQDGARGWIARMIVKSGRGGDFRDPERIRLWAHGVARELTREPATP